MAEAVNNARSLSTLVLKPDYETPSRDPSGMIALANALREHTALKAFSWVDSCSRVQLEAFQSSALDPVLWLLPTNPHLQTVSIRTKCASVDALKNLLQM